MKTARHLAAQFLIERSYDTRPDQEWHVALLTDLVNVARAELFDEAIARTESCDIDGSCDCASLLMQMRLAAGV